MGLLANNFRDNFGCYRFVGATLSNNANPSSLKEATHRTGATRNLTAGTGVTNQTAGYPYGYRDGGAWSMPQKAGALSSVNESESSVTASGNAAQGLNRSGAVTAAIVAEGNGAAVAAAVGESAGVLTASGVAVAPLNAEGVATCAIAVAAELTAPADISGASSVAVAASLVTRALGNMESLPISQELTADAIATTVWNALAAANNAVGTMGAKLNTASTGGVDYEALANAILDLDDGVEANKTLREAMRIVLAAAAGKASGMDGTTATFRDTNDTKNRIVATVDANGNRTAVTLDAS